MAIVGRLRKVWFGVCGRRKRTFKGRTKANIAVVSGIGDSAFEAECDIRQEAHCERHVSEGSHYWGSIAYTHAPSLITYSKVASIPCVTYPIGQLVCEPSLSLTEILPEPSQLIAIRPMNFDPFCTSS